MSLVVAGAHISDKNSSIIHKNCGKFVSRSYELAGSKFVQVVTTTLVTAVPPLKANTYTHHWIATQVETHDYTIRLRCI